ncbi:hypothetical protein GGE67_002563 [Rhizobium leucaenae]|uniref:Uncharacterized protein n=1 Tax=Rhizobium leucaenae TaxID=29450 RepID=A0A7W6ZRN9_9HYPH|nr:hypothetical protein [Rhizobium leucaenae]MBB6301948.1 hypothetical protein [Rhizobium leucaenae]
MPVSDDTTLDKISASTLSNSDVLGPNAVANLSPECGTQYIGQRRAAAAVNRHTQHLSCAIEIENERAVAAAGTNSVDVKCSRTHRGLAKRRAIFGRDPVADCGGAGYRGTEILRCTRSSPVHVLNHPAKK